MVSVFVYKNNSSTILCVFATYKPQSQVANVALSSCSYFRAAARHASLTELSTSGKQTGGNRLILKFARLGQTNTKWTENLLCGE